MPKCACATAECVINNYWQCKTPGCSNGPWGGSKPPAAQPATTDNTLYSWPSWTHAFTAESLRRYGYADISSIAIVEPNPRAKPDGNWKGCFTLPPGEFWKPLRVVGPLSDPGPPP
jgi:hypothetical protein